MDTKMIEVAKDAALKAGKVLLDQFGKNTEYSIKEDFSASSQADKDAEEIILKAIKESFPDHAIVAEESGSQGESDYQWFVDPLDGTANFVRGIPIFGVSIALAYKSEIILGVVYLPVTNELYWAEKGKGTFLNGNKITVSQKNVLKESLVIVESARGDEVRVRLANILAQVFPKVSSFKKFGCSVYGLSLLARGQAEIYIDVGDHIHDQAAGLILVQEAGGEVSDFSGNDWQINSQETLITNSTIHEQILEIVKA